MDKKEHLRDDIEIQRLLEEGFDFNDLVGQEVSFKVTGIINKENKWDLNALVSFGVTNNGVDWARSETPISTTDDDYDAALANVMLKVVNVLNDPETLAFMRLSLNKSTPVKNDTKELM